jgi:hypothetical protein
MHVTLRARPDETLTVKLPDGRIFTVSFRGGAAHVPEHVGKFLIERGYATAGSAPNPKPQFEQTAQGHGALLPMFAPWVKEITPLKEQPTTERTKAMNDEDEAKLQELNRLEKLKGPRNSREQAYFQAAPPTADETAWQEAQAQRQEALKKNPVLPPRQPRNFIADTRERLEREARHERLKAATQARLG